MAIEELLNPFQAYDALMDAKAARERMAPGGM